MNETHAFVNLLLANEAMTEVLDSVALLEEEKHGLLGAVLHVTRTARRLRERGVDYTAAAMFTLQLFIRIVSAMKSPPLPGECKARINVALEALREAERELFEALNRKDSTQEGGR